MNSRGWILPVTIGRKIIVNDSSRASENNKRMREQGVLGMTEFGVKNELMLVQKRGRKKLCRAGAKKLLMKAHVINTC